MDRYLRATGRPDVADAAKQLSGSLRADAEVEAAPEKYYDRVIEIDLSTLEPYINGPFTPDAAHTISEFGAWVREKGIPQRMEVGLIGSCTNSSYQDLGRAASVARQAIDKKLKNAGETADQSGFGAGSLYGRARRDSETAVGDRWCCCDDQCLRTLYRTVGPPRKGQHPSEFDRNVV